MNTNRDRLDDAIDRIAARMTNVEDDAALAGRIVAALPERSARSWRWLMPRLAVGTFAALTVAVVLRPFYDGSTDVLRTEGANVPLAIAEPASNDRRTIVEPPVIVRRTPVEHPSNDRRTISDHEFSLPSIPAPEALIVDSMAPEALAGADALELASLVIADLPLTAEFPPRD